MLRPSKAVAVREVEIEVEIISWRRVVVVLEEAKGKRSKPRAWAGKETSPIPSQVTPWVNHRKRNKNNMG